MTALAVYSKLKTGNLAKVTQKKLKSVNYRPFLALLIVVNGLHKIVGTCATADNVANIQIFIKENIFPKSVETTD